MATDGVKIIDGDLAFDIYGIFFEMYNKGESVEALISKYEEDKNSLIDSEVFAEDYEILITVYALSFWEIGALTADMLKEVEEVIAKQASVKDWTEQIGEHAGKARQRELDKFLKKISVPKKRPKPREKEKKRLFSSEKEGILFENAVQLKEQCQLNEAQQLCEQILAENPDCYDARYMLIECLVEKPKHSPEYPRMNEELLHIQVDIAQQMYEQILAGNTDMESLIEKSKYNSEQQRLSIEAGLEYEKKHIDWVAVEEHCKYMINHRDTDRNELSPRKKVKISFWYHFVVCYLIRALRKHGKYREALKYLDDYLQFTSNMKDRRDINDYGNMYKCYYQLNDTQGLEEFKEQFKKEFPSVNAEEQFAFFEKYATDWF